jgi:hypothetical protein
MAQPVMPPTATTEKERKERDAKLREEYNRKRRSRAMTMPAGTVTKEVDHGRDCNDTSDE